MPLDSELPSQTDRLRIVARALRAYPLFGLDQLADEVERLAWIRERSSDKQEYGMPLGLTDAEEAAHQARIKADAEEARHA